MIFSQNNPSDLINTINQTSLELAQAASDYGALKVVFGIFIVFMIILILMFIYQIFKLNNKIDTIYDSSIEVNKYFGDTYNNSIDKSQANILLRRSFNYLETSIKYNILKIRLENNIKGNQDKVKNKIKMIINNEMVDLSNFLGNFKHGANPLRLNIKEEDIKIIIETIIEQVYNEDFKIHQMDSAIEIIIQGLKLNYLNKL